MKIVGRCMLHRHGVFQESPVGVHEDTGLLYAGLSKKCPVRYVRLHADGATSVGNWRWDDLVLDEGATYSANRLGRLILDLPGGK